MKSDNKTLLTNTVYLYVLTAVKMVFPLISLPYLARVLTTDANGLVTYVKTYASYIQLFLDFGFLLSATKTIALLNGDKKQINYIIGDTYIEKILLGITAALFTLLFSCFMPILKNNICFVWLYFAAVFSNLFVADYLFRGIEKMGLIAIPYTITKSISLVCTILFVKNDDHLLLIPVFELVGNVFSSLVSIFLIYSLGFKIKHNSIKKWISDIKESGVYFISNFATTLFGSLTTIISGYFLSLTEIAYWGYAMQIVSAAKAMYSPISNSIFPYMVKNKDIRLVKKIAVIMLLPMIMGSLLVLIGANQLFSFVFGKEYYYVGTVIKYLLPVIVSSFYSMLIGWPVLGAIGKTRETTFTTVIAAMVQMLCIGLIIVTNSFSLISLSVCCCVSEVFLLITRFYFLKKNSNSLNVH